MINRLFMALAATCLFAMTAITFIDVMGRYFFNSPLNGAQEVISILLGVGIFLALPSVTHRRGHITVDVLDQLIPVALRRPRGVVVDIITVLSLGAMAYVLYRQGKSLGQMYMATPHLGIPLSPILFGLSAASVAAVLLFLPVVFRSARGRNRSNADSAGDQKRERVE